MNLTKAEILALEPGRPVDAAVAELMGWKQKSPRGCDGSIGDCSVWEDASGNQSYLFRYSTDIAAAMEVVDKIRQLVRDSDPFPDQQFSVSFSSEDCGGDIEWSVELYGAQCHATAEAPILPLAITKAALLWALELKEREQAK